MLALSVLFHLTVFFMFVFVPESIPTTRPFEGIVYEVNLVELPGKGDQKAGRSAPVEDRKDKKVERVVKKDTKARRIPSPKKEEKPLVIAKRTVQKKTSLKKEPKTSPSKLIDRAISRIERKVKSEDSSRSHVDRAISKLQDKVGDAYGPETGGGGPAGGIPMRIYQMEVESWIKGNWAYPVAMESQKNLEAIVLVMVKMDGAILKTRFKKRSSNDIFDQSVLKAIERADPLPPFPEGYRKSYEEFEINFNLRDLEND
jgi:colicin import membrane protein